MRAVEYWRWRIVSETTGKPYDTRHKMTERTALERHPEAVRVLGSMEIRNIAESPDELAAQTLDSGQRHG